MDTKNVSQIIIDGVADDIPLMDIYRGIGGGVKKTEFFKAVISLIKSRSIRSDIMVCYCGIDCSRCKTLHATVDDYDELRKTVQAYYDEFGHNIDIKDLNCLGCRSDSMLAGCADCPYMKCGKGKGLSRCDECAEYPCDSLRWYIDKYIKPGAGKFFD